ncbi:MFS transporter [Lichenihabitans sp. Uapishka_5]|uniref:MFS transporter n=1 Tax=Lichenihabitans sp. Uapishka_5 TaxID=3037302 RepID=UPI0029E7EE87|nr:MFS transporter [Lichenihabitans sp. Uapishka_5]MDX7953710.1 MFS transporter [Lichenihabitans sp. Uapishka_5]
MHIALGGIGTAFADANFRRYSVGAIISWLSFFIQTVAVAWLTWDLTHSTTWLAVIALLDAVPMSVLAPLGGIIADRHDRFRILMVAYSFATLQAALLAALAFSGTLTIERLGALTLLHGLVHAFSVPAQFGLLPRFVARDRLPSAIAVASAYSNLGFFLGPALAGWVILHFGVGVAFASNVVGYGIYFWSAALLQRLPEDKPPIASNRSIARDFIEGVQTIVGHRGIRALLALMTLGDALAAAVRQMLPAFSDRIFHSGVQGLSALLAGAGAGATLAALWLAQGGMRRVTSTRIIWAFLGFLAATLVLLTAGGLSMAVAAMVARGFCFEICRTALVALLQTSVSDAVRGRIMSTQFLLQQGARAAGVATIGWAATDWGLRGPLFWGVLLAALVWSAAFWSRHAVNAAFTVSTTVP